MIMTHGVSHLEVFNAQLPDSLKGVHMSAAVSRTFDSACKCFLLSLLNTGQMQLPKDPHRLLSTSLPFLILQVYIPTGKSFTLEIAFSDLSSTKRRIVFANTREIVKSQQHVRVPNYRLKREVWMNLCVDVSTCAKIFFPGCAFKCLDQVRVGAVCRLRRILCMRNRILDTTGDLEAEALQYGYDLIPATMDFPKTVRSVNQFVDCADCRLPDEKLFFTEPRAARKEKGDFLPDIGGNLFVRKHKSLNVRPSRRPGEEITRNSQWLEDENSSRVLESPGQPKSFPASLKLPPAKAFQLPSGNKSIFRSPESPVRNLSPEFFQVAIQDSTEVRHFTPPFVNVTSDEKATPIVRYDPVLRAYDPGIR